MQQEQIKETAAPPNVRFDSIRKIHDSLLQEVAADPQHTLTNFATSIGAQLVEAGAVSLEQCAMMNFHYVPDQYPFSTHQTVAHV